MLVLLPYVSQVRELATQIQKLKREGFKSPFVFVDLRKCAFPPPRSVCERACMVAGFCLNGVPNTCLYW